MIFFSCIVGFNQSKSFQKIKETDNINKVLNNRMKNYASTNILFNAFTRSQDDTSITNISAIICEDNNLCDRVLSSSEYNMIKDGIDVSINAIVQETQNIYNDFNKIHLVFNQDFVNNNIYISTSDGTYKSDTKNKSKLKQIFL